MTETTIAEAAADAADLARLSDAQLGTVHDNLSRRRGLVSPLWAG